MSGPGSSFFQGQNSQQQFDGSMNSNNTHGHGGHGGFSVPGGYTEPNPYQGTPGNLNDGQGYDSSQGSQGNPGQGTGEYPYPQGNGNGTQGW